MKRFFLVVLLVFLFSSPVLSQSAWFSAETDARHVAIIQELENLRRRGDFEAAASTLNKYLAAGGARLSAPDKSQFLAFLGLLNWNQGKPADALARFRESARLSPGPSPLRAKIEKSIAIIERYDQAKDARTAGDFQKSIALFDEAVRLSREIGQREFEVKSLRQQSLVHWETGDLEAFHTLNEAALAAARELNFFRDESVCLNNIGLYYSKIDNFSRARKTYEEALALAEKTGYAQSQSDCLTNLGILYEVLGDFDKALAHFSRALEIDQASGAPALVLIDLNNIGTTHRKKGQLSDDRKEFESALAYFQKSLDLLGQGADPRSRIRILNNVATAHSDLGDYPSSIRYYREALDLALARKDVEGQGSILNNIGIVLGLQGDDEAASEYLGKAIALSRDIADNKVLWEAFLELANTHLRQGNLAGARDNYEKSIAIIEKARSSIDSEELKARFLGNDKRLEPYQNIFGVLVRQKSGSQAGSLDAEEFDYYERSRARAFLDSFEISRILSGEAYKGFLDREKDIDSRLSQAYKELIALPQDSPRRAEAEKAVGALEEEYEKLKADLRSKDPRFAGLKYPEIITLDEAQRSLIDKDTVVFSYILGKQSAYGIAITRSGASVFPIPGRRELQLQVTEYLRALTSPENRDFSLGSALYQSLIEPGLSRPHRRMLVIPDDILHYLPFEALRTKDGKWLLEAAEISYAPSFSSLREIKSRGGAPKKKRRMDLLALASPSDSAKFAVAEVEKIKKYFKADKSRLLIGPSASEDALKKENLENFKILHFAAHGTIDDQKPERSALSLYPDPVSDDDGLLQTREIFNMKTGADLVVLSSCESGLGRFIRGEGIEGMNRAFFFAGASSVLMSLWQVDDEASSFLMERFYYYLKSTNSVVSALQKARVDMIRSNEYSHPYYWAAFITSGDAKKNISSFFLTHSLILLMAAIIALISIFIFIVYKIFINYFIINKIRCNCNSPNRKIS